MANCSICHESVAEGGMVVETPFHVFHQRCIQEWNSRDHPEGTCPCCVPGPLDALRKRRNGQERPDDQAVEEEKCNCLNCTAPWLVPGLGLGFSFCLLLMMVAFMGVLILGIVLIPLFSSSVQISRVIPGGSPGP